MAVLLAMSYVRVLAPWLDSGEIVHRSGTIKWCSETKKNRDPVRIPVALYMYGVKMDCSSVL